MCDSNYRRRRNSVAVQGHACLTGRHEDAVALHRVVVRFNSASERFLTAPEFLDHRLPFARRTRGHGRNSPRTAGKSPSKQRCEFFEDFLAVAPLTPGLLRRNPQDAINPDARPERRTNSLLLALLKTRRSPDVEQKLHARRDLVDVLPARTGAAAEAELQLAQRYLCCRINIDYPQRHGHNISLPLPMTNDSRTFENLGSSPYHVP